MDEPFGRQPKPVTVGIAGEDEDVTFWMRTLMHLAEYKGDQVQKLSFSAFTIYPQAVND